MSTSWVKVKHIYEGGHTYVDVHEWKRPRAEVKSIYRDLHQGSQTAHWEGEEFVRRKCVHGFHHHQQVTDRISFHDVHPD